MNPLQAQQAPYDLAIFSALIDDLPEECEFATLEVDRNPNKSGETLGLSVTGDGLSPSQQISEELFLAVRKLSLFIAGAGHDLRGATYTVKLAPDGNWDTKAIYYYAEDEASPSLTMVN